MRKSKPYSHYEKPNLTARAYAGVAIMAIFIAVLLCRIAYLQILDHQKYTTLSNRNQLRLIPIPPTRGLIYDRNGVILARNVPAFHLAIIPEKIKDLKKTLADLNELFPMSGDQQKEIIAKISQSPSHQRQILKLKLNEEEVSRFAVNQYRFPGVFMVVELIRDYPFAGLFAHVIGYVSEINKDDMQKIDKKRYAGTYQIGKTGLEKFYEAQLQGEPGYQQMETDVMGREVRALSSFSPVPGADLHLSIDVNLQQIATDALGENKGSIVVMDPKTGEILAMVSTPFFDPNLFVRGLDSATYKELRDAPERPLFNRSIQGQYPPASTVKPLVGLAGLSQQKINPQQRLFDPGYYQINGAGRQYRDWQEHGHGWVDLEKSIRESCDIYYYILAEKLGITQLSAWFKHVGWGQKTGVDIPGEQKGIVPSHAWKKKAMGQPWYPGETLITGIGQGYTLVTPLQLALGASYLANRGQAFKPHLNKDLKPEPLPALPVDNQKHWSLVIEPMRQVTQAPNGTAYRFFAGTNLDVAGKTGTAQVFGLKQNEKYKHDSVAKHLRDHSLFIGFAPASDPKIAIAVLLENQKASAGVARQVIENYFMEKKPHAANTEQFTEFLKPAESE